MHFSVLLSVYYKENPTYLNECLESIWTSQTLKPSQIVLVKDGPLNEGLDAIIEDWKIKLAGILTVIPLVKNVGLANALNEGLKYCKSELVARMDTDDIADPNRFHKQIIFMNNNPDIAVSSGLVEEWSQDLTKLMSVRELPLEHLDIIKFAKKRCPISHPAAVFQKEAVINTGGYPQIYPEDYPLWGSMLNQGYKFANLPDTLVKMRIDNSLIRRDKFFLKGEIKLFKYLHNIGFLNSYELYRNILQRTIVRRSPKWLKKKIYKYFR